MLTLTIALACVGLGLVHRQASRMRSPWLGAVVPALYLVGVIALFVQGHLDSGVDYAMAAVGLLVLARIWDEGRSARTAGAGAR